MNTKILKKSMVGEVQLSYKKHQEMECVKITCSQDIAAFIRTIFPEEQITHREYAYVIFLNRAHHILGYYQISAGGLSSTIIDPKVVFQAALLANCQSILLCHNHPSGNLKPSFADKEITKKIKNAGNLLDIVLLDHIIITKDEYYSFADKGEV